MPSYTDNSPEDLEAAAKVLRESATVEVPEITWDTPLAEITRLDAVLSRAGWTLQWALPHQCARMVHTATARQAAAMVTKARALRLARVHTKVMAVVVGS